MSSIALATQLRWLFVVVVALATVIMGVAWVMVQKTTMIHLAKSHVTAQSEMTVHALQPALGFHDLWLANRILSNFVRNADIINIRVYDAKGVAFASYRAADVQQRLPALVPSWQALRQVSNGLQLNREIRLEGRRLGYLSMVYSLEAINSAQQQGMVITLLVMLGSVLLALLVADRLLHLIIDPIQRLAQAMGTFSPHQIPDLERRKSDSREIVILFDGYHTMRARLQQGIQAISEQRRVAEESEALFRQIVEAMPIPVVMSRLEGGDFVLVNAAFAALFRLDLVADSERNSPYFYRDMEQRQQLLAGLAADGEVAALPLALRNGAGEDVEALISSVLITYQGEQVLLNALVDVTEMNALRNQLQRVNAELEQRVAQRTEALQQAVAQAERANRDKSHFLAAASHDLRQPIHAIVLYLDVLATLPATEEQKEIVGLLQQSTNAFSKLFDGLLDMSRMDAGAITAQIGDVALDVLLRQLMQQWLPSAAEKGLELRLAALHEMTVVRSDVTLLERVLSNLLANAVRYTDSGGILLGCRHRDGVLRIAVWDTGCGIDSEQQQWIFDTFYQIENPERDRSKGVGLGLSIVKRQADLMGHTIYLRSRPGRGSCFAIDVPIATAEKPMAAVSKMADSTDMQGQIFLVIEDEQTILQASGRLLQSWGAQTWLAEDLSQASALLTQHEKIPDCILSDYRLRQQKNGLDAIQQLRQQTGREIPAILISGDRDSPLRATAAAANCILVRKPINSARLKQIISAQLNRQTTTKQPEET
ncbi:MAG: ATP-binding protein [Mariprofundales bacterium]